MLHARTRWNVEKTDEAQKRTLQDALDIPNFLAHLLVSRGFTSVEDARNFLNEDGIVHDPFLLYDMSKAVKRILSAIKNEENIVVYGDYDADGVTSTSVMMSVLQSLNAKVSFYIPNRFTEGYGPNEAAFRNLHENGCQLIITVDTGIAAIHEINVANELGMDIIITDHHEPGKTLPDALAIIHPRHPNGNYPFPELAGVGVAFKVAHALTGTFPEQLLDLFAIGTIADLVPLVDENRSLVKKGLRYIKKTNRVGIMQLCNKANTKIEEISEETIGFAIAPRLNAVGRLYDANPAVDLLMTQDIEEAKHLADEIDEMNKERQSIVTTIASEAVEMVEKDPEFRDKKVIVIGKEGWNAGVVGIVAARLVEKFWKPTIVLSFDKEKGIAKGSARSIPGFDLFQSLSQCREILPHFGGHTMAAGMTLNLEHVYELEDKLNQIASIVLTPEDFIKVTNVQATVPLEDISIETIEMLASFAPFGMANPKPIIAVEDVTLSDVRQIGAQKNHLKLTVEKNNTTLDGVGFGLGDSVKHIASLTEISMVGELSINEWKNIKKPQIMIKDISLQEWQLFDSRGNMHYDKWLSAIPTENTVFIAFHKQVESHAIYQYINYPVTFVQSDEEARDLQIEGKNIVLLDIPPSLDRLENLIKSKTPERLYTHFLDLEDAMELLPSRNHFKWLYGFLMKNQPFDIEKYGERLRKHKGWSETTLNFMLQVFFDLEFVTIEDGKVILNKVQSKRDLTESSTFQNQQAKATMKNTLLYSSYRDLRAWFEHKMLWSVSHKEEVESWT